MVWLFIYFISCGVIGAIMASMGCGINSWQWWAIAVCVGAIHAAGMAKGGK